MALMQGTRAIKKTTFRRDYDPEAKKGRKLGKRQRKQVKQIIRNIQELKHLTVNTLNSLVTDSPAINSTFFDVTQGDGDSNRDGDRLQWCGFIDLRMQLYFEDTTNVVRLLIFQWHPNSIPGAGDILLDGPTGTVDWLSVYNHDTRQQYKILWDKTFSMVGNGTGSFVATTDSQILRHYRIPLTKARKMVQFVGGTLQGTNRLYFMQVSDSPVLSLAHPTLSMQTKVVFRDS